MAFCGRIGSLIRQSLLNNGISNGPVPLMSMANRVCCMSASTKLFVGGLSFGTDDHSLRDAFASFGDVTEARVIMDRETGRSRGFGFVNFASGESASAALTGMDGQDLQGRNVRVSYATERPSGGGGYGGGGYGGGGFGGDSGRGGF